jgi:cell division septal protein FtsQ
VVQLIPLPRRKATSSEPVEQTYERLPGPDEEGEENPNEEIPAGRSPEQLEKARRRQASYIQKRRAQKKKRVFYSRIRATFKITSALILLVLMYSALTMSFWRFSPEQFSVHGNTLITRQHLEPFVKALADKPLYQINPLKVAEKIQAEIPYAEHVYVRRRLLPVGLDISVVEKPVWGILYTMSGSKTSIKKAAKPGEKPVVTVSKSVEKPMMLLHWDNSTTDLTPYALTPKVSEALGSPVKVISDTLAVKVQKLDDYRDLVQLLSSRPKDAKLLYLNISNPNDVTAKFDGFNVRIGRMDGSLKERVVRLFSVLQATREHQQEIQWVDLRWHQQVLFKKKSEAQIAAEKQRAAKLNEQPTPSKGTSAVTFLAPESPETLPAEPVSSEPLTKPSVSGSTGPH